MPACQKNRAIVRPDLPTDWDKLAVLPLEGRETL